MNYTKLVQPIKDSRSYDVSKFDHIEVYDLDIPNEVFRKEQQKCFGGAWYHKVLSSRDRWLGIEGLIRLGEFIPDKKRYNTDGNGRNMDSASIYIGGNALEESDAGLGMNLTYLSDDVSKELEFTSPKVAYRPFWRYIYKETTDFGGNIKRASFNSWNISEPKSLCYYYFPGDLLRFKLYSPVENYLQFRIEVVEATANPKYVELRKKYKLKDNKPQDFYSPMFISEGHGNTLADFKRVNSIDQYGNEGYIAKDTDAIVSESTWVETFLYREIDNKLYKVPFTTNRQTVMTCPTKQSFTVDCLDASKGAEKIVIHPGKAKGWNK